MRSQIRTESSQESASARARSSLPTRSRILLAALLLGLVISAILLSNWKLRFAIDTPDFYAEPRRSGLRGRDRHSRLAGFRCVRVSQPAPRETEAGEDHGRSPHGPRCSDGLANPLLARRPRVESSSMAPRPVPPDQIKTPSIQIGIQEGRGGSTPPPPRPTGPQ
jgi:hypothetical protein